jgi:hypothetical protein
MAALFAAGAGICFHGPHENCRGSDSCYRWVVFRSSKMLGIDILIYSYSKISYIHFR